jgi:hypothetical protein
MLLWFNISAGFFWWAIGGFNGKFNDQFTEDKLQRNNITTFIFFILLLLIIFL